MAESPCAILRRIENILKDINSDIGELKKINKKMILLFAKAADVIEKWEKKDEISHMKEHELRKQHNILLKKLK